MKRFFKRLVLLTIVGGIVAAFALGILDFQTAKSWVRGGVGTARAAAGAAVSGASGVPHQTATAGGKAAARQCRENLQLIQSAKKKIESRSGVQQGAVSWSEVLKEMRRKRPACPSGGEYALGSLQDNPTCSIGSNGTSDPDDDHRIWNY